MTMGEEIDRLREIRDAQALMIERLRAAHQEIVNLQDRSFISGEGLLIRAILISRKALKPVAVEQKSDEHPERS